MTYGIRKGVSNSRLLGCLVSFLFALVSQDGVFAQNSSHEIGVSLAYGGQAPFVSSGNNEAGFFRLPLIWNIRYQVATNFIQSLAIVIERVSETRNRDGLFKDIPNSAQNPYNAEIAERLYITTLGFEGMRTLIRSSDFRIGIGVSLAYGFGGATADVTSITTKKEKIFESCDTWNGFMVSAFMRAKYMFYSTSDLEVSLTGNLRGWGFPFISPLTDCQSTYNGPSLRSIFEIGYLAGISVGFK